MNTEEIVAAVLAECERLCPRNFEHLNIDNGLRLHKFPDKWVIFKSSLGVCAAILTIAPENPAPDDFATAYSLLGLDSKDLHAMLKQQVEENSRLVDEAKAYADLLRTEVEAKNRLVDELSTKVNPNPFHPCFRCGGRSRLWFWEIPCLGGNSLVQVAICCLECNEVMQGEPKLSLEAATEYSKAMIKIWDNGDFDAKITDIEKFKDPDLSENCTTCKTNPPNGLHTCPYAEEIHGTKTLCNCCKRCEQNCCDEI